MAVPPDEVIAVARRLVRIKSENPPGDTREVCRAIVEELEPSGFEIEVVEPVPGFASVVAAYSFAQPGRTLILNGHVDVVPVGETASEWTHDPWGGEIDGGRLYGRGALDMKGQVAALLVAARTATTLPLRGRLVFTAVADEEEGGKRGAGALVEAGKVDGDAVVIVEGSDGGVTLGHRGLCFVQLTTRGKAAHASVPETGVNAVEAMLDVLAACRSLRFRHEPHPLLGSPSLAIGTTIAGGTKANVVPDVCRATLDVRHVPGMTESSVVEDIETHFRTCGLAEEQRPDVEVLVWGESSATAADEEIVQAAVAAHEREFGRVPALHGDPAATDAWWFTNRAHLPTIAGLGPGGNEGIHCVDEHVDVEELVRYARVYLDVIRGYLGEAAA